MTLGAPLHQAPQETPRWNDKGRMHPNRRLANYNMMLVGQKLRPHWGATVIDAFEAMEGNGPLTGTMVDHRIAVASTDYLAADRVMLEAMGVKADTVGHLVYCAQAGLGQYDLAQIAVRGEKIADVRRSYRMPTDVEATLEWMRPLGDESR